MPAIRTILCPIDFSDPSREALSYALEFAERCGASVTIAHVCEDTPQLSIIGVFDPSSYTAAIAERARTELEAWTEQARKESKVEVQSDLREGPAFREIDNAAKAAKADLIIMGTRGESRFFMGSVTERVAQTASVPVLTFRSSAMKV